MKKTPMPTRGGNYRVDGGVLTRDESDSQIDDAAPVAGEKPKTALARTRTSAPKKTPRAGSPARKR